MLKEISEKIKSAQAVYDVAIKTPLEKAPLLSQTLQQTIFLKREDLQSVFSFKLRGAYLKISRLSPEEKQKGVITASAGNHAQGVALAGQKLGIKARIVMPQTTPEIKVKSVQRLGGEVLLIGDSYDEALAYAQEQCQKSGISYIHAYDDWDVITGQGTIAKELSEQWHSPPDAIFVPVGGGGLAAGIIAYIKTVYPQIKIIGVEPEDAPTLKSALAAKKRIVLDRVGLFADGVAVKQIGEKPFEICKDHIDDVILVTTDEICAAIKDVFDDTRSIAEPAGALSVAGLKKYARIQPNNQHLIAIISGANMNFDRLQHIAERTEIGEAKEALFAVTIPETPGSFKAFCNHIGKRSVTEFNYRYAHTTDAKVFVGIGLKTPEERYHVFETLNTQYPTIDLTDNELAKVHIRHLVGGKAQNVSNEKLFRVQFPERPGALLEFLNQFKANWNISLFHYRNHGAAYGRVLVGFQVPKHEEKELEKQLRNLPYESFDETNNPAFKLFL